MAVPVAGATATLADGFLAGLLVVGAVAWLRAVTRRGDGDGDRVPAGPEQPDGSFTLGLLLLVGFAAWVAASGLWGPLPEYALAKGAGYAALAGGVACIAWSGLRWGAAFDAWLAGTALALAVTIGLAVLGPEAWTERVVDGGAAVEGLPLGPLSGPFAGPAGFGDYLVISGVVLWARWPALTAAPEEGEPGGGARRPGSAVTWRSALALAGAGAMVVALALTVSTAWLPAGVLLILLGRRIAARRAAGADGVRALVSSVLLRGAGAAVAGVAMAGLVFSLRIEIAGVRVGTSGLRSEIWSQAIRPFLEFPIRGVGALPHLARTADPLQPEIAGRLWDAQSLYISLLGQFGIVGFALLAAALWLLVRVVRRPSGPDGAPDLAVVRGDGGDVPPPPVLRNRARTAALAALLAMAVHGVAVAGEDLRHWWAVLGIAGLAAVAGRRSPERVEAAAARAGAAEGGSP